MYPWADMQPNAQETSCIPAQAGHYAMGPAATAQTPCLAGHYAATSGLAICNAADPGYVVADSGGTAETPCLPGTYQPDSGASLCDPAMLGYEVPESAAINQTPCPGGQFQDTTGQASCKQAEAGHFAAGPAAIAQTACPAGSYTATAGESACTPASPGHDVSGTGATGQTRMRRRCVRRHNRSVRVHAGGTGLRGRDRRWNDANAVRRANVLAEPGRQHLHPLPGGDLQPAGSARCTAVPAILGTAKSGRTLTCSAGSSGFPPSTSYQWYRDGTPIQGAVGSTYTVRALDEGTGLTCVVIVSSALGSATATSKPLRSRSQSSEAVRRRPGACPVRRSG